MARPNKTGLDYFPLDVDFFEDDKIQLIEAEFGLKGSSIAIRLLCKIYREEGYYYQWGGDQCLLLAKSMGAGVVPGLVDEVVQRLVKRSFFDERVFNSFQILTSSGIQKRYISIVKISKIKRDPIPEKYNLLETSEETPKNSEETPKNSEESTQSKVKKSKEKKKESIKKKTDAAVAATLTRKNKFKQDLEPYLGVYGSNMLNDFYAYWTEPNKSKTKMRFELQQTWDLNLRLKTWEKREKEKSSAKKENYADRHTAKSAIPTNGNFTDSI